MAIPVLVLLFVAAVNGHCRTARSAITGGEVDLNGNVLTSLVTPRPPAMALVKVLEDCIPRCSVGVPAANRLHGFGHHGLDYRQVGVVGFIPMLGRGIPGPGCSRRRMHPSHTAW